MENPFPPGKTFDPVQTKDWAGLTHGTFEFDIGPDGAAVIAFTVPKQLGKKIHVSVSYIDSVEYPLYALNWGAALDFNGALVSPQTVSMDFVVVAADDPDAGNHAPIKKGPNRGYRALVTGAQTNYNIATVDSKLTSETRVQMSVF